MSPIFQGHVVSKPAKLNGERYGDIVWNDYELCFPILDLYEGNIR